MFGNQLKTVNSRVLTGVNETVTGQPLDAIFSYRSLSDRIVTSPEIMATTNVLLKLIGQKAAALYLGKK